mmetsp:Transcript_13157/g.44563  ORF Transcript_13157/g.44563 Transcript_13157/m.44563 type:complete len:211 (-) Transcript_13157:61-693(-)
MWRPCQRWGPPRPSSSCCSTAPSTRSWRPRPSRRPPAPPCPRTGPTRRRASFSSSRTWPRCPPRPWPRARPSTRSSPPSSWSATPSASPASRPRSSASAPARAPRPRPAWTSSSTPPRPRAPQKWSATTPSPRSAKGPRPRGARARGPGPARRSLLEGPRDDEGRGWVRGVRGSRHLRGNLPPGGHGSARARCSGYPRPGSPSFKLSVTR